MTKLSRSEIPLFGWRRVGRPHDAAHHDTHCDLCNQHLRWIVTIEHPETGLTLHVGAECAKPLVLPWRRSRTTVGALERTFPLADGGQLVITLSERNRVWELAGFCDWEFPYSDGPYRSNEEALAAIPGFIVNVEDWRAETD